MCQVNGALKSNYNHENALKSFLPPQTLSQKALSHKSHLSCTDLQSQEFRAVYPGPRRQ